jgi:hypothetical protein
MPLFQPKSEPPGRLRVATEHLVRHIGHIHMFFRLNQKLFFASTSLICVINMHQIVVKEPGFHTGCRVAPLAATGKGLGLFSTRPTSARTRCISGQLHAPELHCIITGQAQPSTTWNNKDWRLSTPWCHWVVTCMFQVPVRTQAAWLDVPGRHSHEKRYMCVHGIPSNICYFAVPGPV